MATHACEMQVTLHPDRKVEGQHLVGQTSKDARNVDWTLIALDDVGGCWMARAPCGTTINDTMGGSM